MLVAIPASLQDIVKYTSTPLTHQTTNMSDANSQDISTAMTVISANIEGLISSKASMLSEMCKREHSYCLCLQETHRAPHLARSKTTGMTLVAEQPHIKYGSAILIRSDLKVKGVSVWEQDNVELIPIDMHGVVVHSMYKPPNEKCVLPALGYGNLPHIVIGDFNSHSTTWGYTTMDHNGQSVEQWADSCNLTLINNANLSTSCNSARWKKGYNPDLIFVSECIVNMCGKSVMESIPHTQHRPICVRADPVIVAHPTPFRRFFNIRKADWNGYSAALDKLIEYVQPIPEKYSGFVENVRVASRRYVPRGCRTNYIRGIKEHVCRLQNKTVCKRLF